MKFLIKRFWLLFMAFLGFFVFAQNTIDPMNFPKLTSYVTDFSSVLSSQEISDLNSLAANYEKKTSNQFVAVLFPNRNGQELFDIGIKLFNENKIGQAGKNNGLLLLISTEEKKIRIIVGYGLEGVLPDALVSRIIEQDIRPLVNQGNFSAAVRVFYERCSQAIDNQEVSSLEQDTAFFSSKRDDTLFFLGAALGFILVSLLKVKKMKSPVKYTVIVLLCVTALGLMIFLGTLILVGVVAGIIFGFSGFMPGRGGKGFGGGFGSGGGGFGGGGGFSGGGGAGD